MSNIGHTRVNLSHFVSSVCLNGISLVSSPYVLFISIKSYHLCVCVYDIFEVYGLINIVFKVIYLHEILCPTLYVMHASCVTHRLYRVALESLLVRMLACYFEVSIHSNELLGDIS